MGMNDLDSGKCQKSRRGDISGIFEMFNDIKTKDEQCSCSTFWDQTRNKCAKICVFEI